MILSLILNNFAGSGFGNNALDHYNIQAFYPGGAVDYLRKARTRPSFIARYQFLDVESGIPKHFYPEAVVLYTSTADVDALTFSDLVCPPVRNPFRGALINYSPTEAV